MWVVRETDVDALARYGITPTYVGSTDFKKMTECPARDHPHVCG